MKKSKGCILILLAVLAFGYLPKNVFAQTSPSGLYVPLIGITSVPDPLALPKGPGQVTYHYAVKNFLSEYSLNDVRVVDDTCSPVTFIGGDDNGNALLEYNETWRYACATKLSTTTQSIATATGSANDLTATHKAYATVVVGSSKVPPLVSIVNITKVAYPLSLPREGGSITFTYRVNNPGVVPLSDVTVTDDKCASMSGKLGDTNGNNLLDTDEVWIYTCTMTLTQTTTNTVTVTALANGLRATDSYTITVNVDNATATTPNFPDVGTNPDAGVIDSKSIVWAFLAGILATLVLLFAVMKYKR